MVTDPAAKQRIAQHLLARLDSDKLDAVVHLLETMVPVKPTIPSVPPNGKPLTRPTNG